MIAEREYQMSGRELVQQGVDQITRGVVGTLVQVKSVAVWQLSGRRDF